MYVLNKKKKRKKYRKRETTKEEKMTWMAILQREVDRLRADLENV
jgi:hypothetical protein